MQAGDVWTACVRGVGAERRVVEIEDRERADRVTAERVPARRSASSRHGFASAST